MGLATSLSYLGASIVLLLHFRKKDAALRFVSATNGPNLMETIKTGLPFSTGQGASVLRELFVIWLIISLAGSDALTAYSIQGNVKYLASAIVGALGVTVSIYAGMAYGEENRDDLREIMLLAFRYSVVMVGIGAAAVFMASGLIARLYTHGDGIAAARFTICCLAASLPFSSFNTVFAQYLQATKHLAAAHACNVMNRLVLMCISAFILGQLFGVYGVWLAIPLSELLMTIVAYVAVCVHNHRIVKCLDDLLLLPDVFDATDADKLRMIVDSENQVIAASERAVAVCNEHELDARTAYIVGLCIEELVGNVFCHGVAKRREKSVDIRVVYLRDAREGTIVLRIRDNCQAFNPVEKGRIYSHGIGIADDPLGPEHNIGLKMVFALADSVQYTGLMKLNNLLIRINASRK